MTLTNTTWPSVEIPYTDEFGLIQPAVYRAAGELWPQAESLALATLGDGPAGLRQMLKAVALVSRQHASQPDHIHDLKAYLFSTFKHLVLAEMEKESGHRQRELEQAVTELAGSTTEELDQQILIRQIYQRMDSWTREVFELLGLGYKYEDMAPKLGRHADAIRKKYDRQLRKIRQQINH